MATRKVSGTVIFVVVFLGLFWPFRQAFVDVPFIPNQSFLVGVAVLTVALFLALIRIGFKRKIWKQAWDNDPSAKLYKTPAFVAAFAFLAFVFGCWTLYVSAWQPYYFGDPSAFASARLVKIASVWYGRMPGYGNEVTLLDPSTGNTYSLSWPSGTLNYGLVGKTVCLRGQQSFVGVVYQSMAECGSG